MKRMNPYYSIIRRNTIFLLLLTFSIIAFNTFTELSVMIMTSSYLDNLVDGNVVFINSSHFSATIVIIIYGTLLSYKEFNGAMSIKSNRKEYLKYSIVFIIIVSIILSIFSVCVDLVSKLILEYKTGYNAYVYTNLGISINEIQTLLEKVGMGMSFSIFYQYDINYIEVILNTFLIIMGLGSLGFMLGALIYRLKKMTSILIFIGIPLCIILFIIGNIMNNYGVIHIYLIQIILLFTSNNIITITSTILSFVIGILLLRNAPIKEYAHDLI
ncbi:hypothetical protein [Faecalimicrobium sp. JNUCC 81]